MKLAFGTTLLLVLTMLLVGYGTGFWGNDLWAVAAPPLSLEGFLDEKLPTASGDEPKLNVDNDACYVCHGNYKTEEFVVYHGQDEVGCIDCHGESLDHRGDEDNITPPEKMYAPEGVGKTCGACHEDHDAPAAKVIARWQERCPTKTDPKTIVCTDCHGAHRLKFRTVWWDKKTGKLIIRKEGQRTKPALDLTAKQPSDGRPDPDLETR